MRKSIILIVGLVLLLGAIPAANAAEEIEVGLLYPLTGPLTEAGKRMKAVYEVAAEIINNSYDIQGLPFDKTEGIPNKNGAKLVLKFYDTQGSPEVGKAETERILQEGSAKLIIGAYQSAVTKPTSFVAERNKFPYLCGVSSSAALTERGMKYFFRVAPTDFHDSRMFFEFLDDMREQGRKVKRIAMVYEKTEFGVHAKNEVLKRIKESGGAYELVADIPYEYKSTDVNAEVLKVKAAHPDVIIHASLFSEMTLFAKTYKNLGVHTNANLSFCGGYQNPKFASGLGKTAEGYMGSCTFAEDFIRKKAQLKTINDMYKKITGMNLDGIAMEGFTTLFVAADAFNRAKDLSPDAIRDALATTALEIATLPGKGVKFDENGQNIWIGSTLSQIQKGEYKVVWPNQWATTTMVWELAP
ncbi:MAG: ABC transporter substrate-binding protein [Desulfobacterales bacterium]|jgi:branched-chain amino acid transport system substrate-binding protein